MLESNIELLWLDIRGLLDGFLVSLLDADSFVLNSCNGWRLGLGRFSGDWFRNGANIRPRSDLTRRLSGRLSGRLIRKPRFEHGHECGDLALALLVLLPLGLHWWGFIVFLLLRDFGCFRRFKDGFLNRLLDVRSGFFDYNSGRFLGGRRDRNTWLVDDSRFGHWLGNSLRCGLGLDFRFRLRLSNLGTLAFLFLVLFALLCRCSRCLFGNLLWCLLNLLLLGNIRDLRDRLCSFTDGGFNGSSDWLLRVRRTGCIGWRSAGRLEFWFRLSLSDLVLALLFLVLFAFLGGHFLSLFKLRLSLNNLGDLGLCIELSSL